MVSFAFAKVINPLAQAVIVIIYLLEENVCGNVKMYKDWREQEDRAGTTKKVTGAAHMEDTHWQTWKWCTLSAHYISFMQNNLLRHVSLHRSDFCFAVQVECTCIVFRILMRSNFLITCSLVIFYYMKSQ